MQCLQVQMWRLLLTRSTTESRPSRPQVLTVGRIPIHTRIVLLQLCSIPLKKVGFYPAATLENLSDKFNDYVRQVSTFPGFFLEKNERTEEHRTSENYDLMIKDIVNAYRGYGTGDVNLIAEQVENSAKSILHKSSKKSEKAIFSQDTITQINGMHYITIFYCTLKLDYTKNGKKTLVDQKYSINRSLIRINSSYLVTYAEKLEAMIGDGGLEEWGRSLSSPTGTRRGCRCDQVFALAKGIQVTEEDFEAAPKEA
ncbi:hypothetical protein BGW42_003412 [Actinomortierella wolfii]|nr:hypothetical protein BGW42_003412 [Actinomortierella wolfii]